MPYKARSVALLAVRTRSELSALTPFSVSGACAHAREHLLGGARHVLLEPEEHSLTLRHHRAVALLRGERMQHVGKLRLQNFVRRARDGVVEPGAFAAREEMRMRMAEALQRAIVGASVEAIERPGAEKRYRIRGLDLRETALRGERGEAFVLRPKKVAELVVDARARIV